MPATQIKDILKTVRHFHEHVRDLFNNAAEDLKETGKEDRHLLGRTEALLRYLARHEEHFAEVVEEYERQGKTAVLDTWMQFADQGDEVSAVLESHALEPGLSIEEIVRRALEFDGAMVALYRQLATETSAQSVQEFFADLIKLEESKSHQYSLAALDG